MSPSGSTKFRPGDGGRQHALRASAEGAVVGLGGRMSRGGIQRGRVLGDGSARRDGARARAGSQLSAPPGQRSRRGPRPPPPKALATDRSADVTVARDDPERVARALRELRQRLQILVGEQLGVGSLSCTAWNTALMALRLAFGGEDLGLLDTFRGEGWHFCFSPSAVRILDALTTSGGQDRGALLPARRASAFPSRP